MVGAGNYKIFVEHFEAKSRWLCRTGAPEAVRSLLPWRKIDRLIATNSVPADNFKVMVNRNEVERRLYRDSKTGLIHTGTLHEMAAQGATLLINGISHLVPPIAELAAETERQLGQSVNVNCYLSFGQHSAFHAHYDDHDVIAVQVHGAKQWRCYGVDIPFPLHGAHTSALQTPVWEGVLGPGDILYLPRGDVHAAIPVDRPSVHLTIGITEHTGVDFIKWLAKKAEGDEVFRRGLAKTAPTQHRAAREHEVKQALHALIDATPIAGYFADDDKSRAPRPVAAFDFDKRLMADSVLVSALRRRIDLETANPDECKVDLGGKQMRLSAVARHALQLTTERDRLTFAALAEELGRDIADRELIDSLGDLARKALIEIVA
ncbi:MAG: cupin domain-containing protein [Pseudolabrys sp.]